MVRHCLALGQRAPNARQPGLLLAREPAGAVVMLEFHKPGCRNIASPGFEIVIGAVPSAVPSLLVLTVRVGAEQYTAWFQGGVQLAQDARQRLGRYVKQ